MRGERGSVSVLAIGLFTIVVAMLFVAAAATSIYLQHRHLLALADDTANALARSFDEPAYYLEGRVDVIDEERARRRADELVSSWPARVGGYVSHTRLEEIRVEAPSRVVVRLSGVAVVRWWPAFLDPLAPRVRLDVTSHAELAVLR